MEQFGLLLLIVAFWLVHLLVRWVRGQAQRQQRGAPRRPSPEPSSEELEPEEELPPILRRPPQEELPPILRRVPPPPPAPALPPVRVMPPRAPVAPAPVMVAPPRRRRSVLGTPADLRRAFVLREVLGPCRAIEESEQRGRKP